MTADDRPPVHPDQPSRLKDGRGRVLPLGPCWPWPGGTRRGYGKFGNGNAHRAVYEGLYGPVPAGYVLDHLCERTRCCNPHHLEVVTHGENIRRAYAARRAEKTATDHPTT